MRSLPWAFAVSLLLAAPALAAEPDLAGKWQAVVVAFNQDEFFILDLTAKDGGWQGQTVAAQPFLGEVKVKTVAYQAGELRVDLELGPEKVAGGFRGKQKADDPQGPFLGSLRLNRSLFPARLERTDKSAVGASEPSAVSKSLARLRQADAEGRLTILRETIDQNPAAPQLQQAYSMYLQLAPTAAVAADEVQKHVDRWLQDAAPYGPDWTTEIRLRVIRSLANRQPYAGLTLKLAKEALAQLGETAPLDQRAAVMSALASAAKLFGDKDLATEALAKSEALEGQLDAEYLAKKPDFEPAPFRRKEAADDRVALVELFTGAQCPPCVAADVAFDALVAVHQPTEVIGLQYHLHIPAPDPLSNLDAIGRSRYYALRGTPSLYINGMPEAPGGGGFSGAKNKYQAYREIIDERLTGKKRATLELSVRREGQKVVITAEASAPGLADRPKAEPKAEPAKAEPAKAGEEPVAEPGVALRLVLVEENVRYPGTNGIRFHHHVVRAMPGGPEGKPLVDGKCQVTTTVDLELLAKELTSYVDEFEKTRPFPGRVTPPELQKLLVVAFVQDDVDKSVWHARQVAVPAK